MRRRSYTVVVVVFVLLVLVALAVRSDGSLLDFVVKLHGATQAETKAATVAGKWTMTVKSPHGVVAMALTLEQNGTKVAGTFTTPHDDLRVEGEFTDRTLTLATPGAGDSKIAMTAKLKDNGTLDGYLSSQMGDMAWTAERVKEK